MANEKKKKNGKKTTAKRTNKTTSPKAKATKPEAKKSAPKKSTSAKKTVKASRSKTGVQKPERKQSTEKKATAKNPTSKQDNLKPDWNYEKDKPKSARGKKEEIIINIPKKSAGQPKAAKSVTKRVTEQLPDNAKLRTIHLHFRLD